MEIRSVEDSRVEMTELVLPSHTNNHNTAFGGQIAAWCDICAAVAAQRFCRKPVVTASMDELHFLHPVKRGMVVILRAQVNQAWQTSMEIGVRVEAEDPLSGETVHCCSAYLTFVALNAHGKPCQIPKLDMMGNEEYKMRGQEAQLRRDARLKMREMRKKRRQTSGN
ncbi:MAG: acyl-CoA thioesterase [Myxococcota bacterium]|nr:acyl-CoA thioesterase [Myxococcota bacterium]